MVEDDRSLKETSNIVEEVRDALDRWNDAWNRGDLSSYLDAYADGESTRYVSNSLQTKPESASMIVKGKEEINALFSDVFEKSRAYQARQSVKKGVAGLLSLTELTVEQAGDSDAVAFGQYVMEQSYRKRSTGVFTIHVRKINGVWRILSEHSTPTPPMLGDYNPPSAG